MNIYSRMKNKEQKKQSDKKLKEYFQSLNLTEWTITVT